MDRPFCTYRIKEYDDNSFYIGANSEKGFLLTPDGVFEEENFDKVYILKGGPGTGKSTFMKKAAKEAAIKGACVTRYFCSSDPDSLDAVIIEYGGKRLLIIDGTHPHVTEMQYPGAVSEIINLSIMWDSSYLGECRDRITELTKKKSICFASVYKYLNAAAELQHSLIGITERVCNLEKLNAAISRFTAPYKKMKGICQRVYIDAFSMSGAVTTGNYFKCANEIYYLSDVMGISSLYLSELSKKLDKEGIGHVKIMSPVNSEYLSGVYITDAKVFVTGSNYGGEVPSGKKINMKRFLTGEVSAFKGRYRFGEKCKNALYEGAAESLHEASKHHFDLEEIYIRAMNFKKVNRIYKEKISALFAE